MSRLKTVSTSSIVRAEKVATSRDPVKTIMGSLLVEIALADEWYRVFIGERRVGLGVAVSFVYLVGE